MEIEKTEKIIFSKKGNRELTEFMARELLYDYATQFLDEERTEAVRKAINSNPQLAKELEDIYYGMTYCQQLSLIKAKSSLVQKMKTPFNLWRSFAKFLNIRSWNPGIQWVGESLIIATALLVLAILVPWNQILDRPVADLKRNILLSEIRKKETQNSLKAASSDQGRTPAKATDKDSTDSTLGKVDIVVNYKYVLKVANPLYTYNKLPSRLNKFGAQILEQSLVPVGQDNIPRLRFSLPSDKFEPLVKELESHGKLTLTLSSGENSNERGIWTFEIELEGPTKP